MTKPTPAAPQTEKAKSPVRMPQRSEEISGDERHDDPTAIAAVEAAKLADKKVAEKKAH